MINKIKKLIKSPIENDVRIGMTLLLESNYLDNIESQRQLFNFPIDRKINLLNMGYISDKYSLHVGGGTLCFSKKGEQWYKDIYKFATEEKVLYADFKFHKKEEE